MGKEKECKVVVKHVKHGLTDIEKLHRVVYNFYIVNIRLLVFMWK